MQTHVCAKCLRICAQFVLLNAKQEKQELFFMILAQFDNFYQVVHVLWHFKPHSLRKSFSLKNSACAKEWQKLELKLFSFKGFWSNYLRLRLIWVSKMFISQQTSVFFCH